MAPPKKREKQMELVYLNVGGVYFVTKQFTLRQSDTFFSGLVECASNSDAGYEEHFIDRDPTHFRYVLNWLRGVKHLPDDDNTLKELLWEADFYSMADMVASIQRTKRYSLQRSLENIVGELRQR